MFTIPRFYSISDLEPVLKSGVRVIFPRCRPVAGYGVASPVVPQRGNYLWEIKITADQYPDNPTRAPWNTSLLDEQKITLLHEFIHLFNIENGFENAAHKKGGEQHPEYEMTIDAHSISMVRHEPLLLENLVMDLTTRENCTFVYELLNIPFFHFHRELIRKHIGILSSKPLKFGDRAQINLLKWVHRMNL